MQFPFPTIGCSRISDVRSLDRKRTLMDPSETLFNPARRLTDLKLEDGWEVGDLIPPTHSGTGGHHSFSYHVHHHDHGPAFLKALNTEAETGHASHADRIKFLFDLFVFERDLLTECTGSRLSRITHLWSSGESVVPSAGSPTIVPYLILELADGDIRRYQDQVTGTDLQWCLLTLHHVTVGIQQLHSQPKVAHQDLKPSNVLTHDSGRQMKLGDLGRAERVDSSGPNATHPTPGDATYAPPEQLYGGFDGTWGGRKIGDVYQIGGIMAHLLVGHGATALLVDAMPDEMTPLRFSGSFPDVLPQLQNAHSTIVHTFAEAIRKSIGHPSIADPLVNAFSELSNPDPTLRGHPHNLRGGIQQADLQRYVSLFDRLEKRTRFSFRSRD